MSKDIREVKNITDLIGYFSTNLGWNVDIDDFDDIEDISYDFDAADIGLKEESFAKISSLRQLQPLVDGQQWGIFCVEFDSNKFEPSALKKILSGLIPRKRNSADHAVWCQQDLLFICNWGVENNSTIGVVHFEDRENGLPQIKMFSCAPALEDFTQIKIFEERLAQLAWPKNTSNIDEWREVWSSAFTIAYKQTIQDSSTLTVQLAAEAQEIRNRILDILSVETKNGYVHLLFEKFRDTLIHDMTEQQFADMYAQTVVYGLFSARCLDQTQEDFSAVEAIELIPNTNPFLKSLMKECFGAESRSKLTFDELEIDNVVELLKNTKTDSIIQDFNRQTGGGKEDPVIHFYEEFLTAYDKAQKVQRGVFYTPQPVVNFIVKAVDSILKTEFGLEDGLASEETKNIKITRQSLRKRNDFYRQVEDTIKVPAVQILDPATGTGTFLRQTILQIYENFLSKHSGEEKNAVQEEWNKYVDRSLLPRVNGFELMMAPYAVAHMKLAMVLKDTGYKFTGENRLNVFLTNSLEEAGKSDMQISLWDDPLATESIEANAIKKNAGINVILGNPPYAGESSNKGNYILELMEDYKYEPGTNQKLQEANSKFVNDDYVKFIRYAQSILEANGDGVICFINPHGYIDSPTFRGVRYSMLKKFQSIYVIDLHGNSKKKEKSPDGSKDENVFDIQQGVCINIFVKKGNSTQNAKVFHADLYGLRDAKYSYLSGKTVDSIEWEEIKLVEPNYSFSYKENANEDMYNKGFSVRELFPLGTLGVLSKRDSLVVAYARRILEKRIEHFLDQAISTEDACAEYKIPVKDNDKWVADKVRDTLRNIENLNEYIIPVHYRPFDIRYLLYQDDIVARPNKKVLQHLNEHENLALVVCRQGGASNLERWDCAFTVDMICDQNIYRRGGGTVMPLYIYHDEFGVSKRTVNMDKSVLATIENHLGRQMTGSEEGTGDFSPEDLLGYITAYLYSEKYREKYKEYLSKEFPKIPYPTDYEYFCKMAEVGKKLISIQTRFEDIEDVDQIVINDGSNVIEKITFKEENLFINKSQSFYPVSQDVFDYTIGGNSPIHKWLKDRKGEELSAEEITIAKKIIVTIGIMIDQIKNIDDQIII